MGPLGSALVVEDDPMFLEGACLMLRLLGFSRVQPAADAETALEHLGAARFDLVLSDWNMEPMSGLELLVRVRATPRIARTPFVLMTANLSNEYWVRALEAGATDFLYKPFSREALRDTVTLAMDCSPVRPANVMRLRFRQRRMMT
jgi:CheY-like chemotaxis protein